ncbi:MAG: glycosyltransferase [Nitrospiraceae bacterium]|nr:glycosyltransferase [Nitrospiraceae bacterium]
MHYSGISAVICTFNRANLLSQAVSSIAVQDFPAPMTELIVVDNASSDNTIEVVRDAIHRHPSRAIRYVHEREAGLSAARNRGVKEAKFEIVAFMDDDAMADACWLKALWEAYGKKPDARAVGGPIRPWWEAPRPRWLADELLFFVGGIHYGTGFRRLKQGEFLPGGNFSVSKRAFEEVGLFDNRLGMKGKTIAGAEEIDLQDRVFREDGAVYYHPSASVKHWVPAWKLKRNYFMRRGFNLARSNAIKDRLSHSAPYALRNGAYYAKWILPWCIKAIMPGSPPRRMYSLVRAAIALGYLKALPGVILRMP